MNQFKGKVAVVTGSGAGIGRALCRRLGALGARVACSDINGDGAAITAAMVREQGGAAFARQADVGEMAEMQALADAAVERFGRIDYLFNVAGVAALGSVIATPFDAWERIWNTNFRGVLNAIRSVYPTMARQRRGHIINVSSLAGFMPAPGLAAYSVSKAGVCALSDALSWEVERKGIQVTIACPGYVRTGLLEASASFGIEKKTLLDGLPFRMITPDAAAREIVKGVATGKKRVIFPFWARLLWRLYRIHPAAVAPFYRKMAMDFWQTGAPPRLADSAPPTPPESASAWRDPV